MVSARLPHPVAEAVEKWAESNGMTRSSAICRLVELGLAAAAKPKAKR